LGVPGDHGHRRIRDAYKRVADACAGQAAFGVAGVADPAIIADYVAPGARFVSAGSDLDLLLTGARKRTLALRELTEGQP
jgi:2-keto-3-deoxy-L-rhamnonate aldolase RhmA